MGPKQTAESREDREARLRERRRTQLERNEAAQDNAASLTSDLRSVYGRPSLFGLAGRRR